MLIEGCAQRQKAQGETNDAASVARAGKPNLARAYGPGLVTGVSVQSARGHLLRRVLCTLPQPPAQQVTMITRAGRAKRT